MNNIRYTINQISVLLLVVWMTWPFFSSRIGGKGALLLIAIWLLSCDLYWLRRRWTIDLVFVGAFFGTFIPYILTRTLHYGAVGPSAILQSFPLFFLGMFVNHYYMYYKNDYKTLGKISLVAITSFLVGSVQTILVLQVYPMASRILATSDASSKRLFVSLGAGGFGYIYGSVLLLVPLIFLLRPNSYSMKSIYRLLVLSSIISILFMILRASYATSIIIAFIGICILLISTNKKNTNYIMIFVVILLLFLFRNSIGIFIEGISELFASNEIISEKMRDLSSWITGQGRTYSTEFRLYLYESSFRTFLNNPIFGIYGPFPSASGFVGGHSGWLDLMAFYGLFSSVPLALAIFSNFRKHFRFFKATKYAKYLLVSQVLFVIMGLVNPIIYIYEIGFIFFAIVPGLPFLSKSF